MMQGTCTSLCLTTELRLILKTTFDVCHFSNLSGKCIVPTLILTFFSHVGIVVPIQVQKMLPKFF